MPRVSTTRSTGISISTTKRMYELVVWCVDGGTFVSRSSTSHAENNDENDCSN